MRAALLALLLGTAAPAAAQEHPAPFAVALGEWVRVELMPAEGTPSGAHLVGRVHAVSADALALRGESASVPQALPWARVSTLERRGESRTGEVLGMLLGGVAGGLAGYVLGDALSDDPLARAAFVPGALSGLLVGGVVGARAGDRWHDVPPASPALGFRATVPLR